MDIDKIRKITKNLLKKTQRVYEDPIFMSKYSFCILNYFCTFLGFLVSDKDVDQNKLQFIFTDIEKINFRFLTFSKDDKIEKIFEEALIMIKEITNNNLYTNKDKILVDESEFYLKHLKNAYSSAYKLFLK